MATAGELITAAFIKIGIGSPTAAQTASALISLNDMVSSWGGENLIYAVTSEGFTVTAADAEYTIGSGGDWDTVRPNRIISAFLRNSDNYDWPLRPMSSKDYNRLSNKSFDARPNMFYFLPEYPLAKIIFNCSPDDGYSFYAEYIKTFTEFALTTTAVTLPPEYKEALVYNLAISLGEDWDRTVSKTVIANAIRTKQILDALIASQKIPPLARFDFAGIGSTSDSGYSIVTDDLIDGGV